MTWFWRFLCFFAFRSFLVKFRFFLQKFKNGKRCPTRTYRFDSRLCSPQVFTILVAPLVIHGCHRPGGQSAPPGPRLELANFWQHLPPLNRPPWFTFWSQNSKILKNKKVCSQQKKWSVTIILFMNCKMAYIAHKVLLGMLYDSSDDISSISKIHSRQLIILWFWRFLQKKIKSA